MGELPCMRDQTALMCVSSADSVAGSEDISVVGDIEGQMKIVFGCMSVLVGGRRGPEWRAYSRPGLGLVL